MIHHLKFYYFTQKGRLSALNLLHFILNPLCQRALPKLALHEQAAEHLAIKKKRQAHGKELQCTVFSASTPSAHFPTALYISGVMAKHVYKPRKRGTNRGGQRERRIMWGWGWVVIMGYGEWTLIKVCERGTFICGWNGKHIRTN